MMQAPKTVGWVAWQTREKVLAQGMPGQPEPVVQPAFAPFGELLHEFAGPHAAEHGGEGEDFEACGKAFTIDGCIGISWHSGNLDPQGNAHEAARSLDRCR